MSESLERLPDFVEVAQKRLEDGAAAFDQHMKSAIERAEMPATKAGLAIIALLFGAVLIIQCGLRLFPATRDYALLTGPEFATVALVAALLVALGHWVVIDERRYNERAEARRIELRSLEFREYVELQRLEIERLRALPQPTPLSAQPTTPRP